jgi:hypothetical protein
MQLLHMIVTGKAKLVGVVNPGNSLNQAFWIAEARSRGYHTSRAMSGFILIYR